MAAALLAIPVLLDSIASYCLQCQGRTAARCFNIGVPRPS